MYAKIREDIFEEKQTQVNKMIAKSEFKVERAEENLAKQRLDAQIEKEILYQL